MSKKETIEKTPLELLYDCGYAQLSIKKTMLMLSQLVSDGDLPHYRGALEDEGSKEFRAYAEGWASGEAGLQSALMDNAIDGKRDGYKNLQSERRTQAINAAIKKNFGIGESSDE